MKASPLPYDFDLVSKRVSDSLQHKVLLLLVKYPDTPQMLVPVPLLTQRSMIAFMEQGQDF